MQVLKRSGAVEEYNPAKIQTSIENAAGGGMMNSSDSKVLADAVTEILSGKETVASRHIHTVVVGVLYCYGFPKAGEAFISHSGGKWAQKL